MGPSAHGGGLEGDLVPYRVILEITEYTCLEKDLYTLPKAVYLGDRGFCGRNRREAPLKCTGLKAGVSALRDAGGGWGAGRRARHCPSPVRRWGEFWIDTSKVSIWGGIGILPFTPPFMY